MNIDQQIELEIAIKRAVVLAASPALFQVNDGVVSYRFRDTMTAGQAELVVGDIRRVQAELARLQR